MSLESALALALICFIAMVTPGPGILALLGHALSRGFRRSLGMMSGMILGDMIYVLMVIGGMALIARSFETTFLVVRLLAAGYLIVMGVRAWRAPPMPVDTSGPRQKSQLRGFVHGLALTLSNPKVIVFYIGILPGFVDLAALDAADAALASSIILGVLIAVLSAYVAAAARIRLLLKSERSQKIINRGSGSVLIGAGIAVAAR